MNYRQACSFAVLLLLGCTGRDAEPPATKPGQSASTNISAWSLAEPPLMVIGAGDSSRVAGFGRVAGALRLANGSIVVSDVQPAELKLFDSTGRYVRTVGGSGSGPGEFRWPGPPRRFVGDSFYVVDAEQRRVSFFDGAAKLVKTRGFPFQTVEGVVFPIGMVSSAQFVATRTTTRHPGRVGERIRLPVEVGTGLFNSPGFDRIARGRGDETVGGIWHEGGQSGVVAWPLEFGSRTEIAVAAGRVFLGETGRPRIDVLDLAGKSMGHFAWEAPEDPVTEADRRARIVQESTRVSGIPQSPDPAQYWSEVEHLRTVELPKLVPAFTAILPTEDGSLWVEQDPRPWTPSRLYLVFDSTRALVARVTVPRTLTLYQVDGDLVLCRWREPGEADQVRLYRLVR